MKRGQLRAHVAGYDSAGFSLTRPKDKFVNPFGCGGPTPCP
jgi:hypothetical protein